MDVPAKPTINKATKGEKIALLIVLLIICCVTIGVWFRFLNSFDSKTRAEMSVSWPAPPEMTLDSGPPSFWYDPESNQLHHRGPLTDEIKKKLVELPMAVGEGDALTERALSTYREAIDRLAYESQGLSEGLFLSLLFLGGLTGILGAMLRAFVNFVGVACYKDELDLSRWWPWYAVRPIVGFLLGVVLILIVKAGLMTPEGDIQGGKSWWLGVSFLAGFGATDFTDRLRLLGKTLFGSSQ